MLTALWASSLMVKASFQAERSTLERGRLMEQLQVNLNLMQLRFSRLTAGCQTPSN